MLTLSVYALSALSMGLLVLRIVYRPASRTPGDILRGAVVGDLPVQASERFITLLNLTTAATLGLTISPSLMAKVDELVE